MGNRGQLNTQTQLSYNKSFGLHNLDALVGFETEDYKYDYLYANGNQYPSYLPEIENAGDSRASSHVERYRMTSFLGRINYDYNNKYYLVQVIAGMVVPACQEKAVGEISGLYPVLGD